tara:strand:- start:17357 stop:18046 length:690 start_codon:yes stop_codon:yes gene_type:complete
MDAEYWKHHWESDSRLCSDDPFFQVGRTRHKKPISKEDWIRSLDFIGSRLDPSGNDVLIDLCCGNGLLSGHFSDLVSRVIAIDFSERLLDAFVAKDRSNISILRRNVKTLSFEEFSYNKVLFHFAAQHFTEEEIIRVLDRIRKTIAPGGMIYIGEIPDQDRKWNFYSNEKYRRTYFNELINGEPAIGTWYKKDFFTYAAETLGFKSIEIFDQPDFMLNENHRFEVLISN